MSSKHKCCSVETMYGYSLTNGVIFVGVSTTLLSVIAFITSTSCLSNMKSDNINEPLVALNILFGIFCINMSIYQIVISVLLIWQAVKTKGNMFLCWLWYISHLSILTFYSFFFIAKTVLSVSHNQHFLGLICLVTGIIYEGVFIYFVVVVQSYVRVIDDDVYY